MIVGIDDTDSRSGMCTTYLAAMLCDEFKVPEYPRLIRLNPNVPYRTRGNGAIAIEMSDESEETKDRVLKTVRKFARLDSKNTNPGVVFLDDKNRTSKNMKLIEVFYCRAMSELLEIKEAEKTAEKVNAEIHKFKNGRGLIGALAAVGSQLEDRTYELISYRTPENCGTKRKIDEASVSEMNSRTYPETFDNIGPKGQILITPRGKDPVFCGIRGNSAAIVERAWKLIKPLEPIERIQIFETNQGTDAHLVRKSISETKPYDCVILGGTVTGKPKTIEGGHVIFGFSDPTGNMECAAYEPTGTFREIVRQLIPGDILEVYGGLVKYPQTLNLEKIRILKLAKNHVLQKPMCCEKTMTSSGKAGGFKCRKCGKRLKEIAAVKREVPRNLSEGFYEVSPAARRHLSKPLCRVD